MDTATKPLFSLRILQMFIGVALVLGAIAMLKSPPGIFSDSVSGFLVMQSMEHGAPFNHNFRVDPDLIDEDISEFTSWWVPAQYLLPGALKWLGLDLGQSMTAIILAIWGLGLWGYLRLFRVFGFSEWTCWASLALIFSQPFVLGYARFYHGGELLQWGYFPWFVVLALHSLDLKWIRLPLIMIAFCAGVFLKSSFLILGTLTLATIFVIRWRDRGYRVTAESILDGLKLGLVFAGAAFALAAYSAMGESPIGEKHQIHISLQEILFALAAPLSSLFGLWRAYIPDVESIEWSLGDLNRSLALCAGAGLGLLVLIVRFAHGLANYKVLLGLVYLGVVGAFVLAFSLDLLISFQVRHFRIAGLLLIPGTVSLVQQLQLRPLRWSMTAALTAACVTSLFLFLFPVSRSPSERPIGSSGFSHIYAEKDLLDALRKLDAELSPGNNLFALPWPQLALEIRNSRTLNMRTEILTPGKFGSVSYYGQVDNLVVVLPIDLMQNELHLSVLQSFKEHSDWERIHPAIEDYVLMHSRKASTSSRRLRFEAGAELP